MRGGVQRLRQTTWPGGGPHRPDFDGTYKVITLAANSASAPAESYCCPSWTCACSQRRLLEAYGLVVLVCTCVAKAAPRQAYQCTVRALGSALAQVARRRAQAGGAPAYHKVVVQRDKAHFFHAKVREDLGKKNVQYFGLMAARRGSHQPAGFYTPFWGARGWTPSS